MFHPSPLTIIRTIIQIRLALVRSGCTTIHTLVHQVTLLRAGLCMLETVLMLLGVVIPISPSTLLTSGCYTHHDWFDYGVDWINNVFIER